VLLTAGNTRAEAQVDRDVEMLSAIRARCSKPVSVVLAFQTPEAVQGSRELARKLRDCSIPTFVSLERGARALKNTLDFHELRRAAG
jgi:hypothetical protein